MIDGPLSKLKKAEVSQIIGPLQARELLLILLPLFMLVRFQFWMILLLFRRDSLPLVRGAILVRSLRARFNTHRRFPLSLGLLNPALWISRPLIAVNRRRAKIA